jgi:hypothetical protein
MGVSSGIPHIKNYADNLLALIEHLDLEGMKNPLSGFQPLSENWNPLSKSDG